VQRAEIREAVDRAIATLRTLIRAAEAVAGHLGVEAPTTLCEARELRVLTGLVLSDPRPLRDWFDPGRRATLEELAAEARRQTETVDSTRATLEARFQDELFDLASPDFVRRFEEGHGSWLRILKPGYHSDLGRLRRLLKEPAHLDYPAALDALKQARRTAAAQAWLSEQQAACAAAFGRHYAGSRTQWASVEHALGTVREITARLVDDVPERLIELLLGRRGGVGSLRAPAQALEAAIASAAGSLREVEARISLDNLPFAGLQPEDAQLEGLVEWLSTWLQGLAPLWMAVDAVNAHRRQGSASVASMAADVAEALSLLEVERESARAADELRVLFGFFYTGLTTAWPELLSALAWAGRVLNHFGESPPDSFVAAISTGVTIESDERDHLVQSIQEIAALVEKFRAIFEPAAYRISGSDPRRAPLTDVAEWARERHSALSRLEEWIDFNQTLAEAEGAGLRPFVDSLLRERPPRSMWLDAFLRQLYTCWLTWRYGQAPALARFRGPQHEDRIDEFRRLDEQQWRAASRRIAERLAPKRPDVTMGILPRSEPAILMREVSKKRRFRPIRKLFADLPNLLPALKPCMLMSPLSVAQFLGESAMTFDVVIFDEASQILPADAIGAIGRARRRVREKGGETTERPGQVVVVGDRQQLPPTRFFAAEVQVLDDEDDEELPESILDACQGRFLEKRLLWHYRSRHEHLIAFSNKHFYDRSLITFPSVDDDERAVEFIHVADGRYDRGSSNVNRVEARQIADLVVEQVELHPDQSLGVITFSERQMLAIQTEIDARKRARPELEALLREDGPEAFFVKNLENVQGDERDVIFFSVGYGPDQTGRMTMNFGPLNRQGGERRLNVAITRARDRVKILASFHPHDIDRGRTNAKGVHLLRSYLEFADQGPQALLGEITAEGGEPESPFEEAVGDALQGRGLRVTSQVGVGSFRIDLGIKHPSADWYVLGIECDGATYHSSCTARDRDRLRQEVLERLGWRIHRVWSTDWLKDPEREAAKLLAAYEQALRDSDGKGPSRTTRPKDPFPEEDNGYPPIEGAALPESDRGLATTPVLRPADSPQVAGRYVEAVLPHRGTREEFDRLAVSALARLVRQCVEVEGPVHEDRVMRAVALCFGIGSVKRLVRARMREAISQAVRSENLLRRGQFLWLREMTMPPVRAANFAGDVREIHEVPPEEIAACITAFLQAAFSISRRALIIAVARELGYHRTGTLVSGAIGNVVNDLIARGTLVDTGGQLRLGDDARILGENAGITDVEPRAEVPSAGNGFALYRRYIRRLKPGEPAGQLELDAGDDGDVIFTQLLAAAQAEGVSLHVEQRGKTIVFWLTDEPGKSTRRRA
jgi:very-short-patch-repair endonuclease